MSDLAQRWRTVEGLYQAALEQEPAARAAFLEGACPDAAIRREVASLLDAQRAGDRLLERPALDYAAGPLTAGSMVGVYRVEKRIGAGGMGEVYRATDTRLHREVALKVLPAVYAGDAEWLARFQREARVLASLNHPNIAAIYGLEGNALVLELVEGPTLAERIARGPLPPAEALAAARQIAEALEFAHEKGVVHRDLKPANIKISAEGTVKVLDFGLAKAAMQGEDSATLTATRAGAILGTPAYMPPEQAAGMPVDKRSDIWAFGVVLFEMLAGRRMFHGAGCPEVLAAVVRDDPPWQELPPETPARIRQLLRRCLDKDPKQRLRDIGEARIAIQESESGEAAEPARAGGSNVSRRLVAALTLLCLLLAGALVWTSGWFHARPVPLAAARLQIAFPEGTEPWGNPAVPNLAPSPDGRLIVFVARSEGRNQLWLQALDSTTARRLELTGGGAWPFWSPDGKWIGFFADRSLKRISIAGGAPETVCTAAAGIGRGTWNSDGVIVFPSSQRGLLQVPATGGDPVPVQGPSNAEADADPQFLPDGRHFLYHTSDGAVYVQELGSGRRTLVFKRPGSVMYASGHLVFVAHQTLFAQPFDIKRFQAHGEPVVIAQNVNSHDALSTASFNLSANGVLAYRSDIAASALKQLTWYDRNGRALGTVGDAADYSNPDLSPDGNWLAVGVKDATAQTRDIWLFDLLRGTRLRITTDPGDDLNPTWSADGRRIAFTSDRRGRREIYLKNPFGTAAEELVLHTAADAGENVEDWSPDGKWLAYDPYPGSYHISLLSLDTRKIQSYIPTPATQARFSADGKWVAYIEWASPANPPEVFVQSFPAAGSKWQISTAGGFQPRWRGDGRELFYEIAGKIMAVDIAVQGGAIQAGVPHALFSPHLESPGSRNHWLVTSDGKRFLAVIPQKQAAPVVQLSVIYNWPALLEKR